MDKLHEIIEKIEDCMYSQLSHGIENIDTDEMYKVADIYKDLVEAKYHCTITKAMEENADEYGETWDEKGKKFYTRMRDSRGRYMRGYEEPMHMSQDIRDMDRETHRRMYTEPMHNESHFERMRREYTEAKMTKPEDKAMHQEKLNKSIDALAEEFKTMMPNMDSAEKQIVRTKMMNLANSL